jgi:hypothetical protein
VQTQSRLTFQVANMFPYLINEIRLTFAPFCYL